MIEIIAIRHGITEWNQQKRIQGRTDIPLADEGIAILQKYSLPEGWRGLTWFSSPLLRTRQTAEQLRLNYQVEPAIIEMHWGDWEGKTLAELRNQDAQFLAETEAKGLDMQPPQGESPHMVQKRVTEWMRSQTIKSISSPSRPAPSPIGMITHKGVIRALLAAAFDWDMKNKPPVKLDYKAAHRFGWDGERWLLLEENIRLLPL